VLASLALATVLRQEPSKSADVALYDALIRKTNELEAFVAVYKAKSTETEESLRIVYRAPGELQFSGLGLQMTARDGVMTVRTPSSWAQGEWQSIVDRRSAVLSGVIETEFGKSRETWIQQFDCGPVLQMELPVVDEGKHDRFKFNVNYMCPRGDLLQWIETFEQSEDVIADGDERRVMKTPRGSAVTLSMRTGFIESMIRNDDRGSASIVLEALDLHPKFDEKTFEPATRPQGVEDKSAAMATQLGQVITQTLAKRVGVWISDRVKAGAFEWNPDTRARVERVLERLFGEAITSETEPWQTTTKDWIAQAAAWLRTSYPAAKNDPEQTGKIDERIQEGRKHLIDAIEGIAQHRPPGPLFVSREVGDPDLRNALESVQEEAWTQAIARVLHDPLLEAFDDAVSKAKAGG
jgi:hypothetical protein